MFKEEKLDVDMLGLIHDEVQVQTKPQNIIRVKEILSYSFGDFITKELSLKLHLKLSISLSYL
jgi:DNA polymerase I-like protein with 3'-5' exonuclease and polymerase domains